jgi:hypothetical protein
MIRPGIETTSAAALLTVLISAVSASAAQVNRPLADELTRQFNQQELEQMQAGDASAYLQPDAYRISRHQLDQPGSALRPVGMSPRGIPPQPEWSHLPQ